jgi:hypothetical protein
MDSLLERYMHSIKAVESYMVPCGLIVVSWFGQNIDGIIELVITMIAGLHLTKI